MEGVTIIIYTLLLSAFFSGMEIAYVSANKIQIEIEKRQKGIFTKTLGRLTRKPSKFIATLLIGNCLALVVYGLYMGDAIVALLFPEYIGIESTPAYVVVTQTVISTGIIFFVGEFLPKIFFRIYAGKFLRVFSIPAYIFYIVFKPITEFITGFSNLVLKHVFKSKSKDESRVFTRTELGYYISEHIEISQNLIDTEVQIFHNALGFAYIKAREVKKPRNEIVAIEIGESPQALKERFIETGFSKIIIYRNTIDEVIGYANSFDLFKRPDSIKKILLPVEFVPETMLIKNVLSILVKKRKSIAIILDEYGGTSGMLTVEDIIEELFGEIQDEHDEEALQEEQLSENKYKFSARLDVDYINQTYKLDLPKSDNYETLGGLVVDRKGDIPDKNDVIIIEKYKITVLEALNTRVETLLIEKHEQEP